MTRVFAIPFALCLALISPLGHTQAASAPDDLMAEELIDLVLEQCRQGQGAQAMQLAQDIREQFNLPPAIQNLLKPILSGSCVPPTPKGRREAHFTMGWDDNVNLGTVANSLTFQGPSQSITYRLDDSYQPVASLYTSATFMQQHSTANNWTLQTTVGARQLAQYSAFNTLGLQVTGRRPLDAWGQPGHMTLGWAETWLGGQHFRSAPSVGWQSLPSRGQQGWVVSANAQHHDYARLASDARLVQATISHQSRPDPRTQISWGSGLLHDQALELRPGGHRQGTYLQASWQHARHGGLWHAQLAQHQWLSAQAFLPGLLDQRRQNDTTTWVMGYQRPIEQAGMLYIEYQHRNSRDSVALYTHRSNQLGVGWLLRWP